MNPAGRRFAPLLSMMLVIGLSSLGPRSTSGAPPHGRLNGDDAQWHSYGGDAGDRGH